jgi:hypothetical protein
VSAELVIFLAAMIWGAGFGIGLMAVNPHVTPIYEVVWWPITLAKYLLKTLYLALFTGWKP